MQGNDYNTKVVAMNEYIPAVNGMWNFSAREYILEVIL